MIEKIYRYLTLFIIRWWILIILAMAGLVAFCYPYTARLFGNISTDLIKLLPDDYTSVQLLQKSRGMFKRGSNLYIVLESDHPEKTREALVFAADELSKDPEVASVGYKKNGFAFFDKHKLLFLDLEDLKTIREKIDRRIQKEKLGSLYVDFEEESDNEGDDFNFGDMESKYKSRYTTGTTSEFITDDEEKIYTMSVEIVSGHESLKEFDKFYDHIKDKVAGMDLKKFDPTMEVYYAGTIRGRLDEYKTLIHDLKVAGTVSGLGIFLLLALYFRRPVSVLIIFIPLACGIICSFAASYIFIKNLNVVTSFLFAVLGGLGVEVGIHMFARYIEERSADRSVEDSIFAILYYTGRSAITSGFTVAAVFLILIVNDFKGFSEFGLITGMGILIIYLVYHILFPATLIAAEKLRILKFKKIVVHEEGKGMSRFPRPRTVLVATLILFVFSTISIPFAGFEYNFGTLKSNIKEGILAKAKMRKTMPTVNRPAVVFVHDQAEANAIDAYINDKVKEDKAKNNPPVLDVYKSWYDVVQYDQAPKLEVVEEIKELLADKTLKLVKKEEQKKDLDRFKEILNETQPIEEGEIPPEVKEIFFGTNAGAEQLSYINAEPHLELDDGRNAIAFAERIEKMQTKAGTFYASSDAIVFADVLRAMLKDVPRVVTFSFLIVFFFVWLDFRNIKKTVLVISPIVIGVSLMFGIMFIFKLKLNFFNMIVIPTVFGTSIDNSIHIYHRYEEMGKGSLMRVLRTSGGAALMSSLTNMLGFFGLVFANHSGLASIGTLAIAGMAGCLFTTLIYFPAMLQWLSDRHQVA